MAFDGSANIHHYATCSTAAATAAKTVALSGFALATGARVLVKFTVTNSAANPTLDVLSLIHIFLLSGDEPPSPDTLGRGVDLLFEVADHG